MQLRCLGGRTFPQWCGGGRIQADTGPGGLLSVWTSCDRVGLLQRLPPALHQPMSPTWPLGGWEGSKQGRVREGWMAALAVRMTGGHRGPPWPVLEALVAGEWEWVLSLRVRPCSTVQCGGGFGATQSTRAPGGPF